MHAHLVAIVFGVWQALHATPDRFIADAISCEVERAPVFDRELLAATMAVYSWKESANRLHPPEDTPEALAGHSCGVWQEPCARMRNASLVAQARYWIRCVLAVGLAAVDSDPARARERLELAMRFLRFLAREYDPTTEAP